MKLVMDRGEIKKEQAEKNFQEILENFQLDLLKEQKEQIENLKLALVPAIQRGRLEYDIDEYSVTLILKKPIQIQGDADDIEELQFSIHNCEYGQLSDLEKSATKGDFTQAIVTFAGPNCEILNKKVVGKLCASDYAAAGAVCTLFLAF